MNAPLSLPTSQKPPFLSPLFWWLVPLFIVLFFSPRPITFLPGVFALITLLAIWFSPARHPEGRHRIKLALHEPVLRYLAILLAFLVGFELVSLLGRISEVGQTIGNVAKLAPIFFGGMVFLLFNRAVTVDIPARLSWIPVLAGLFGLALFVESMLDFPVFRHMKNLSDDIEVNPSELNKRAAVFFLLVPAMLHFAKLARGWPNWRGLVLAVFTAPLLLLAYNTQSQAAQLALPVMLLVWCLSHYLPRVTMALVVGGAALFTIVAPFIFPLIYNLAKPHVSPDATGFFEDASIMPRLELWAFISDYIQQRFWTGYGMDAASFLSRLQWDWTYFRNIKIYHPHNGVLQFWLEMGVSGALLLLAGLYGFYRMIAPQPLVVQRLALTTLSGCLVFTVVAWSIWQSWWIGAMFFIAGLTTLAARATLLAKQQAEGRAIGG